MFSGVGKSFRATNKFSGDTKILVGKHNNIPGWYINVWALK